MSEALLELAGLHPGRKQFPQGVVEALRELNQEPHLLAFAWELAHFPKGLAPALQQDLFLLALALLVTQGQGHTRMALTPAEGDPAQVLLQRCGRAELTFVSVLEALRDTSLVGLPGDSKPLIRSGSWLYSHRMYTFETSLAERINALLNAPLPKPWPVPESIFTDPVSLNLEQRASVQLALERPLALITGGPGTGKTSIVVALLRALLSQPGLSLEGMALAAPTGKAAQRMGEAIRKTLGNLKQPGATERQILGAFPEPKTLHRLLAWHPGAERFRHDETNPLPAQVVIVDESSMISLEHMDALLRALAPGTRLILLGDSDQLPSVEAGRAYKDLVDSLGASCQRLLHSYRMSEADPEGRNILRVAGIINQPTSGDLWTGEEPIHVREQAEALTYRKVELLGSAQGTPEAFLRQWFEREVLGLPGFKEKAGQVFHYQKGAWAAGEEDLLVALFGHFERFRILCVQRDAGGLRGVHDVNRYLHARMFQQMGEGLKQATPFYAGEPVLMTANDYRRGIFNGDQGLALKVKFDDEVRQAAVFPAVGGFKAFLLDVLKPKLEHCYAMTVHKSQGSEYERIALLLPRTNHKSLTKELLYTALTRAKKSVVLLGERERIAYAMTNPTQREAGLAERLQP